VIQRRDDDAAPLTAITLLPRWPDFGENLPVWLRFCEKTTPVGQLEENGPFSMRRDICQVPLRYGSQPRC
jgi:hypothetical protein